MTMRFGAYLYGDPRDTAAQSRVLEQHGFATIWFGEVPTWGFGDAFQGMRDAALATGSIGVGTALTPAGVRPPATLVTQLGTLNSSAPGRITVGLGTGLLARQTLGLPPLRLAEFRSELEQVRVLLDGGVASANGQPIAFEEPRGGVRLEPPIRLLVGAGGPKTAALAGEFGDGILATSAFDTRVLTELRRQAEAAARGAERDPDALAFVVESGPVCIVRDGEALTSPRVLEIVEPFVTMYFVLSAALGLTPDAVPAAASDSYARFLTDLEAKHGANPRGALLFSLNTKAYLREPRNDGYATPDVIAACTLTGHHSELRDWIGDMGRAGVTDIAILRARPYRWAAGSALDDLVRLMESV